VARGVRFALAGLPHLLVQRGNNRQPVFVDPDDRLEYLERLRRAAGERGVEVHAYVLMPDHVHLLATPATDGALSLALQDIGRHYVRWFNRRHGRSGTLWEGRFRCAAVDAERYLLAAMCYVEANPLRAGLVADPATFPWSSYPHHAGTRIDPLITDHAAFWGLGNTPFERQTAYRARFEAGVAGADLEALRRAVLRGHPLGGPQLDAEVAARGLVAPGGRPRGRPRKLPAPAR